MKTRFKALQVLSSFAVKMKWASFCKCDFEEALMKVQRSVSEAAIEKHEKWTAKFGST
jgi:hypothetical protein